MRAKYAILVTLSGCLFWGMAVRCQAVDAKLLRDVDEVLGKGVLDRSDLRIIDRFMAEAVQDLVNSEDLSSTARTRTIILSRKSDQAQYAEQYSNSAYNHISEALKTASELTPEDLKFKVTVNLLILIDALEDVRLADLAMRKLNNESEVVRYWAVHAITNRHITEQLNAGGADNSRLAGRIVGELGKVVEAAAVETLALVAEFGGGVLIPEGENLLLQVADMRSKRYYDWEVKGELLDAKVLKLLCIKMYSGDQSKPEIARRFGQLFSYALQRYIKAGDRLSDVQKQRLRSVLAETEKTCLGMHLRIIQRTIRDAIVHDDLEALKNEHERLFGDQTSAGQLGEKLKVDYGKAFAALPNPPEGWQVNND